MTILRQLHERADSGRPVRIGLIGCGEMGTDIITQVALMPGLEVCVIAEKRSGSAEQAVRIAGQDTSAIHYVDDAHSAEAAISDGKIAVCEDGLIAGQAGQVDVIIDATGNPGVGADLSLHAMSNGKHVVMMNVEADVTVGALLAEKAASAGVVYSLGAGDEPSAAMELIEFAQTLGYPIVAAGKGKNNPLNFDAVPDDYAEEAARRNMNPRMLSEFVDGSKTMIEMTAIANATGLVPDKPGMHGPAASREALSDVLIPREDGGLLSRSGVVDYTIGKGVAPGVFVVIKAPHERIHERLSDLKMGAGPYFTLFRPYHLTSLEVPITAAEAVINQRAHMVPLHRQVAEATAIAKRALPAGTRLGRIGEADYRGWSMTVSEARVGGVLPIGLAENAVTTQAIAKGEALTYSNCKPDETMTIVQLRAEQDRAYVANIAGAA